LEIQAAGWEYFQNIWNFLDILVISVSTANIAIAVYVYYQIGTALKPLLAQPESFGDFSVLGQLASYQDFIFAFNVFISGIKVFKYISFNRTMNTLSDTLVRCTPDLLTFSIMYFIVEMAFIQLANLLFGQELPYFSTIIDSSYTMLRCLLGDFDFPAMQRAQPVLGPIYFTLYIFLAFFILLNMFLAIINDTYSEVKAELEEARIQFEIGDFFMRGYNNIKGSVAMRDKNIDIENAIKMANEDGVVTYEEVRAELKKCNFSGAEIEMYFDKNDADGDGIIDTKEAKEAMSSSDEDEGFFPMEQGTLSARARSARMKGVVTNAHFDVVESRIIQIEHTIGSVISKIDAVLSKMDRMSGDGGMDQALLDNNLQDQLQDDSFENHKLLIKIEEEEENIEV